MSADVKGHKMYYRDKIITFKDQYLLKDMVELCYFSHVKLISARSYYLANVIFVERTKREIAA